MHRPRADAHATANPTRMQTAGRVGLRHRRSLAAPHGPPAQSRTAHIRCSRRKGGEQPTARHPAEAGALPHGCIHLAEATAHPRALETCQPQGVLHVGCRCGGSDSPRQHHRRAAREPPQALWT